MQEESAVPCILQRREGQDGRVLPGICAGRQENRWLYYLTNSITDGLFDSNGKKQ